MSVTVTPTISETGLLSLDINFVAPTDYILKYIQIYLNGAIFCSVQPRDWLELNGTGGRANVWVLLIPSGRHIARIPLTSLLNGDHILSVKISYAQNSVNGFNYGPFTNETSSDIPIANTWYQADPVPGIADYPLGVINGPVMLTFDVPASVDSASVPVTVAAMDDYAVAAYLINESSTPPSAGGAGWSTTPPTVYTAGTPGTKTLYAWAKDTDGNVSEPVSATVVVSMPVPSSPPRILRGGMGKMLKGGTGKLRRG